MLNTNELQHAITRHARKECYLLEEFAVGSYHVLYKATFTDGSDLLARVRWFDDAYGPPPPVPAWQTSSEAATMRFLRDHTSIPIPDVLAVDEDSDGLVGGPFMLLDCIPGKNLLEAVSELKPEALTAIFEQLADCQVQLLHLPLTGIGSLHQSTKEPGHFYVGAITPHTPRPNYDTTGPPERVGPWSDPAAWLEALAQRQLEYKNKLPLEPYEIEMVDRLSHVAHHFPLPTSPALTSSGITHPDLDFHNIMVDVTDDGQARITGIIDWDGAQVLPIWAAAKPLTLNISSSLVPEHDCHPYLPAYRKRLARDALYRQAIWEGVRARRLFEICHNMFLPDDLEEVQMSPDSWIYPTEDEVFEYSGGPQGRAGAIWDFVRFCTSKHQALSLLAIACVLMVGIHFIDFIRIPS